MFMMVIVMVKFYGNSKVFIVGLYPDKSVEGGWICILGGHYASFCGYFLDLGVRKDKDFLFQYTAMVLIFYIIVFSRRSEIIQILGIIYCFPPQLNPNSQ